MPTTRASRARRRAAGVAADQRHHFHPAGRAGLARHGRARRLVVVGLAISVMLYLDWLMTLVVLGFCPIAILPITQRRPPAALGIAANAGGAGGVTSRLTEKLSGARLIKAFRLEDYAAERVNENFEQVFRLRMKAVRSRARRGAHARGAGRRRPLPARSPSPTGASPAAPARSAISWGSSRRCCWLRSRSSRWATSRPRRWKAWPPPTASTSCSTRSRPSSTGPARGRSRSRPARSCSTMSASPTARPRHAGRQRISR